MPEYQDVYDENRCKTGAICVRGVPLAPGMYRLGVRVWIRDRQGRFLLSQRHPRKVCPLYWEPTGGAVDAGEDSRTAGVREVFEELGLKLNPDEMTLIRTTKPQINPEFGDIYLASWNGEISELHFQETEVVDARWAEFDELTKLEEQGIFAEDYRDLFGEVPNVPVAICPMQIQDIDEIRDFWHEIPELILENRADSREALEEFLKRNPNTCFVAKSAMGIVGTVLAGGDGRNGRLYRTAVAKEYRRKGVGGGLVRTAIRKLNEAGIEHIDAADFGENDIEFWKAIGFDENGRLRR